MRKSQVQSSTLGLSRTQFSTHGLGYVVELSFVLKSKADVHRAGSLEVEQQPIRARMCGFGDKVTYFTDLPRLTRRTDANGRIGGHSRLHQLSDW
jgi:hypothetical protein